MTEEQKLLQDETQIEQGVAEEASDVDEELVEQEPVQQETQMEQGVAEEALEVDEELAEQEEPAQEETLVELAVEDEAPVVGEELAEQELAQEEVEVEQEADEAAIEVEDEVARREGQAWYVIHSYSGYEKKVQKNLESRIESMGMEDYIFEVVVPTEEVVELHDGARRTVERRIFPGYVLVDMIMTDESWFVVRNTPGVTGFVGSGGQPVPLREEEAEGILNRMKEEAPKIEVSFQVGDAVRIIDGPFTDFLGTVDFLNVDRGKVRVLVSFFGRETPVELDFLQVEKE
jgi:transcriptional antiterminator NusG